VLPSKELDQALEIGPIVVGPGPLQGNNLLQGNTTVGNNTYISDYWYSFPAADGGKPCIELKDTVLRVRKNAACVLNSRIQKLEVTDDLEKANAKPRERPLLTWHLESGVWRLYANHRKVAAVVVDSGSYDVSVDSVNESSSWDDLNMAKGEAEQVFLEQIWDKN
jgi:hypothetical protein